MVACNGLAGSIYGLVLGTVCYEWCGVTWWCILWHGLAWSGMEWRWVVSSPWEAEDSSGPPLLLPCGPAREHTARHGTDHRPSRGHTTRHHPTFEEGFKKT